MIIIKKIWNIYHILCVYNLYIFLCNRTKKISLNNFDFQFLVDQLNQRIKKKTLDNSIQKIDISYQKQNFMINIE